jgi:hypothetical protein
VCVVGLQSFRTLLFLECHCEWGKNGAEDVVVQVAALPVVPHVSTTGALYAQP